MKVGLLGCGFMGQVHARAWQRVKGAEIACVAGVPYETAVALADTCGAMATERLEDVIADHHVDAVDICLPTHMHERVALAALSAGKHVLCEKPLTLSAASARRIVAASREHGKVLMVAQVVRFWPEYRAAAELVHKGRVGDVVSIAASRTSSPPAWGRWFSDAAKSGGAMYDLLIHDIDYVMSLLGRPVRVFCRASTGKTGALDHVVAHLGFLGGAWATVEAGYMMPKGYPFSTRLEILGRSGLLEYGFRSRDNVKGRRNVTGALTLYRDDGRVRYPRVPAKDGYLAEIEHFADCVRQNRSSMLVPNSDVLSVMETIEALRKSARHGRTIRLKGVAQSSSAIG